MELFLIARAVAKTLEYPRFEKAAMNMNISQNAKSVFKMYICIHIHTLKFCVFYESEEIHVKFVYEFVCLKRLSEFSEQSV